MTGLLEGDEASPELDPTPADEVSAGKLDDDPAHPVRPDVLAVPPTATATPELHEGVGLHLTGEGRDLLPRRAAEEVGQVSPGHEHQHDGYDVRDIDHLVLPPGLVLNPSDTIFSLAQRNKDVNSP
ncbi:MAG: hypothetical protein Q8Q41_03500 [bacterium]|nr:hypothetical protein [bacterium]